MLGLDASTPQLAEGLHDTPFEPPVPRMRRLVTQIRALLRGERIPLAVTTNAQRSSSTCRRRLSCRSTSPRLAMR